MQSFSLTPAACIEKAVCMKTQEELYQKVRLTPRLPRVVLKSNSQHGQQDPRSQFARSSWDPPSDSKSYVETWNSADDYRIPGIPLSTVEQEDTNRKDKVKKLIKKFESHPHKAEHQQVQQRIAGIDRRHEQHRDLRTLQKFFQTAMS